MCVCGGGGGGVRGRSFLYIFGIILWSRHKMGIFLGATKFQIFFGYA